MKHKLNSSGMVSLIVCMIIMIIIALVTISFATLARREQRQAQDKQLSSQAFYAAESGINDALTAIFSPTAPLTTNITTCDDTSQNKISNNRTLLEDIAYTCVFINQSPLQIVDTVKQDESSIFKISGFSKLTFTWENDDKSQAQTFPNFTDGSGNFPAYSSWDSIHTPGVLRLQLIPVAASRTDTANNTIDLFGFPTSQNTRPSHAASDAANNGEVLTGGCSTSTGKCKIETTGLSGDYYLRMISIYDSVNVVINGYDSSGNPKEFKGTQAEIDATGKSGDVFRRIKVYKSLLPDKGGVPDFGLIIGDDLCKRLDTNNFETTTSSTLPMCQPSL